LSVFFTDRNLGKRFGRRLRELGLKVELHDNHFPQNATDEEILAFVAHREWVLLTLDLHLRYRPAEKEAIRRHAARVIHLKISKQWSLLALAEHFARHHHRVEKFLQKTQPPLFAVYRIDSKGRPNIERKRL